MGNDTSETLFVLSGTGLLQASISTSETKGLGVRDKMREGQENASRGLTPAGWGFLLSFLIPHDLTLTSLSNTWL